MSFLQPLALFALPAILVPIIIHLVHLRRQRVVEWGAMMFLLAGARMSRGLQKLRQWLLLALRTLAVLGLVFGVARPIAGGWLGGAAGGRPEDVVVLLDRSPSMGAEVPGTGRSRLAVGVARLAEALATVAPRRVTVLDGVSEAPLVLEGADDLAELVTARVTGATTDLPGLFEAAHAHLARTGAGAAELWVVTDGEASDWRPDDGRWPALAADLAAAPAGVRVRVLSCDAPSGNDLAVRVLRADVEAVRGGRALVLDVEVRALGAGAAPRAVPVAVELGGVRSRLEVELTGGVGVATGHRLDLAAEGAPPFGAVSLAADENPANDVAYFVLGDQARRETVIVAEDDAVRSAFTAAAEAPLAPGREYLARAVAPEAALALGGAALELETAALVVWQAPLPSGAAAEALTKFVEAGGAVLCLPARAPGEATFLGVGFGPLAERVDGAGADDGVRDGQGDAPREWRETGDLLRRGADGTPLPVGEVRVREAAEVRGDATPLATFADGARLLARAPTTAGGAYFLATTPAPGVSNLASEGATLVAIVHRALEVGEAAAAARGRAWAGRFDLTRHGGAAEAWRSALEPAGSRSGRLLAERFHDVHVLTDGERHVALERAPGEDLRAPLTPEAFGAALPGVEVAVVQEAGDDGGLLREVWRLFLVLLVLALIAEAALCVTESTRGSGA